MRPVNEDTGELNNQKTRIAIYGSMKFEIHNSGRIILSGSWHKHYYNGYNYEDFTLIQFIECVTSFCQLFNLDPTYLKLLQLEAGVNIRTLQDPDQILNCFVCNQVGESFSRMRQHENKSIGIELYRIEYGDKIYNKGKQNELDYNLLRFERKMKTGKYFRPHGINVLSDLLNAETWQILSGILKQAFDQLIMKEPSIRMNELSSLNEKFVSRTQSPDHWKGKKLQQRYKDRIRLKKLIETHGTGNLKNELRELIIQKSQELIDTDILIQSIVKKGDVFPNNQPTLENGKELCFPNSYNAGNHHPESIPVEVRKCKTCGRDISSQKKDSVFCSEILFGRMVKRCRNMDSNPRNNYFRAIARIVRYPTLFDVLPFLKPPPNPRHLQ